MEWTHQESSETEGNGKTVVLGFDALDFRYLDAFADDTPNLSALRERGVESSLESTFPPWTGSAWPSMYTGTDPSHHGVYGFFDYEGYPDEGTVISRNDVHRPALWNYLDSEGVPSLVLNVPVTHPADPIRGALIPGYLATEDTAGFPSDVRKTVSAALGEEYTIYSRGETASDKEEKLSGYLELIDLRKRAALSLMETYDWEVAVIQVQKTDAVFHNFDEKAAQRKVYAAADELAGAVLDVVDDSTNVVVCSDHGIGETTGYRIYLNEILRQHGYVETTTEGRQESLSTIKTDLTGETSPAEGTETTSGESVRTRLFGSAGTMLRKAGVSPTKVYRTAKRFGVESALMSVTPDAVRDAAGEHVDWRASKAYLPSGTRLGVRINLEGRESEGIVPQSEYEEVRTELIELLSSLETPDGDPVFEFVKRREKLYQGEYAEKAPDILFMPHEMNHQLSVKVYDPPFLSIDTYDHKQHGVFLGAGPAFEGVAPESMSLTDIAPICMALAGFDVPERMTGEVPEGILSFSPSVRAYRDVPYGTEQATTDGEEEVTERLEDLGYL
ncbi:nucleotide pyrophosphatase [Haloprofundus marisrubri]|uniref:Nucleotide pyrophosphatase n=1 Tax=Haloprofundus marisrubri TaxID=1514971 RepID=A0A0W1R3C7_9EURY|nr:alkaline phosphatase family protein [Haloprofundus marisrubri]KTG07826.1 nucleotide pyrophosphatase [Haloprofundus marisrubri]